MLGRWYSGACNQALTFSHGTSLIDAVILNSLLFLLVLQDSAGNPSVDPTYHNFKNILKAQLLCRAVQVGSVGATAIERYDFTNVGKEVKSLCSVPRLYKDKLSNCIQIMLINACCVSAAGLESSYLDNHVLRGVFRRTLNDSCKPLDLHHLQSSLSDFRRFF